MKRFDYLIEVARREALRQHSERVGSLRLTTVREPSNNEINKTYRQYGTGLLFCVHDRSYFDVCPSCKRTRSEAQKQFDHFCKIRGIQP